MTSEEFIKRFGRKEPPTTDEDKIHEALEFDMLHKPEPPYEARTVDEVTNSLSAVLPDIPLETIRTEAQYWVDCYVRGDI